MTAKRLTALLLGVMPVLPGTMPMLLGVAPVLPEVVAVSALTATADEAAQPPEETPSAHVACERFGDANRNGVIDVTDATLIQYFLAQPAEDTDSLRQSALVMDVDRSGAVDISDATQVQRFVAEFPDCAHVGSPIGAVEEHRLPTALSLRENSLTLGVGECVPLTPVSDVEELPDGVRWQFTSNDPQVASVSPDGVITALSCGVAEVTCACGDVLDSCTVSVQRAASSLTLNADTLLLGVGEAFAFESETDAGPGGLYGGGAAAARFLFAQRRGGDAGGRRDLRFQQHPARGHRGVLPQLFHRGFLHRRDRALGRRRDGKPRGHDADLL